MNWLSFFIEIWGGIVISATAWVGWYTFLPRRRSNHIIYRKGQLPERVH
jgi:hypothetical protein